MAAIIRKQKISPKKLLRAKELRGQMTASEEILWCQLRGSRLNGLHFRRQQVIAGYIVDFYCHSARLIVEVDGPIHDQQKTADQFRDTVLHDRGLRICRFKNEELQTNLEEVLLRISQACGK